MLKERLQYIDIAKGLGIILVVWSHSGTSFDNFISLFHVPLFFFLSGMFHKEKNELNPFLMIKKKIKGLHFPYLRYGFFFLITLIFSVLYILC